MVLSMYDSILQFYEKDTLIIEKLFKSMILGESDAASVSIKIKEMVLNLGTSIVKELYENADEEIRNSVARKENWNIEKREEPKEILDIMGTIHFNRTGYVNKKTGEYIYLLDKIIGLESHQRITMAAAAQILEEATESSYQKGGKRASDSDFASKQSVKKLVHETIIEMALPKNQEKKKIRNLHIVADEDHVSAQFIKEKGDLPKDTLCRKINTIMPKIILLYEDVINESGNTSKNPRYKLIGKHYFCGVYAGANENYKFWEQVRDYIEAVYDEETLEKVYIAGDGAAWIEAGCDIIDKSRFVLDKFHMMKYVNASVTHLLDSGVRCKKRNMGSAEWS